MKSGNWFGNLFTFWWGGLLLNFWGILGEFLGIFGDWQTGLDAMQQTMTDLKMADMTKEIWMDEMYHPKMSK